ncbi:MAG: AAA family ATPase, partial [Spirochaetes bacterium]|nr:AAA family ATPase [Spirochaetota bacterium]
MPYSSKHARWLNYYRDSLVDVDRMSLRVDKTNSIVSDDLGAVDAGQARKLMPEYTDQKGRTVTGRETPVQIAPMYFVWETKHSHQRRDRTFYPFWIPAVLTEAGALKPPPTQQGLPWFIREVLSPMGEDSPLPILGDLEAYDRAVDDAEFNRESFEAYMASIEELYRRVVGCRTRETTVEGYERKDRTTVVRSSDRGMNRALLETFDAYLRGNKPLDIPPLAQTILSASDGIGERSAPEEHEVFLDADHVGQMADLFPLGESQRHALSRYLRLSGGELLAVNGPPGTGKTTLLQSAVAQAVVEAAYAGGAPPKILATSTNNQAIQNILENFAGVAGTDSLSHRWTGAPRPLGTYMASEQRAEESARKGSDVPSLVSGRDGIDGTYFERTGDLDIHEEEARLIEALREELGEEAAHVAGAQSAAELLRDLIVTEVDFIDSCVSASRSLGSLLAEGHSVFAALADREQDARQKEADAAAQLATLRNARRELNRFLENESVFRRWFSFLAAVRRRRIRDAGLRLADAIPADLFDEVSSVQELDEKITGLLREKETLRNDAAEYAAWLESNAAPLHALRRRVKEYRSRQEKGHEVLRVILEQQNWYKGVASALDVTARYRAFALAVHYWEARWIQTFSERNHPFSRGAKGQTRLFDELAHLTPVFVSTCHSLPKFASHFQKDSDGRWQSKPLSELFDLVVVDEAGQVTPEVGVVPFLFAKCGLVVGDIYQIKPIWSITSSLIDRANLLQHELVRTDEQLEEYRNLGLLCSSGSAMRLAQRVSPFRYPEDLEVAGALLREHRRCVDEIIEFCNVNVYRNRLIPLTGSLASRRRTRAANGLPVNSLPALGYAHVPGQEERTHGGSRFNSIEASAIAAFLSAYGDEIRETYEGAPLHEIVGIVTPFKAQARSISAELTRAGLNDEKPIVVGTVHALQGSEKRIVLFSPTYDLSSASSGGSKFFDVDWNMLNVSVSRAKEHFIIIGEMGLFDPAGASKPSSALARVLFRHETNELSAA